MMCSILKLISCRNSNVKGKFMAIVLARGVCWCTPPCAVWVAFDYNNTVYLVIFKQYIISVNTFKIFIHIIVPEWLGASSQSNVHCTNNDNYSYAGFKHINNREFSGWYYAMFAFNYIVNFIEFIKFVSSASRRGGFRCKAASDCWAELSVSAAWKLMFLCCVIMNNTIFVQDIARYANLKSDMQTFVHERTIVIDCCITL